MNEVPNTCIVCGATPVARRYNEIDLYVCEHCGLMWRQSFDVPLSHYEELDGGFSTAKARLQARNIKSRIRLIAPYVRLDDTCDVGGSKGYFVEELISEGYQNVFGIDPNKVQVEAAQKRGIPMLAGSTADAPGLFKERGTKNATLFHVIEHLADPLGDLRQLYAALPPGGFLIIETPDFESYTFKKLNYQHKLLYEEHLFYFSPRNITKLLEEIGFSLVTIKHRDFDPYHLNIHEALFRLGLERKKGHQKREFHPMKSAQEFSKLKESGTESKRRRGVIARDSLREIISYLLSLVVVFTGRQNFMLVIAHKV